MDSGPVDLRGLAICPTFSQEIGIKPSRIETTVFAGYVQVKGKKQDYSWIQVIANVDDLLVFAQSEEMATTVFNRLSTKLKIKQAGLTRQSWNGGGRIRFF